MKKKQQTVSIKLGNNKIVSKPFDFEAMCKINEVHGTGNVGLVSLGNAALAYLFEGTEVTDSVIEALPLSERSALCMAIAHMYLDVIAEANSYRAKNL